MPQLRVALGEAGFADVRTHLQSGNVVVESGDAAADEVAKRVADVVREGFGLDVPVVMRSPDELRAVLDWCPFPEAAEQDPSAVHVLHLTDKPARARAAAFVADDWSPDEVAWRGRELVMRYGNGMRNSRLQYAPALKRLGVDGTARNWRTLKALVDLTT
ncbi:DUF1697 domain-containing protein [Dactylosporangium fulvum]|uniref:DUF1697 domain-containing protein n=2 Tax=Dactylosporangium fulvum TaxID=53359 RepID=A0ABY5WDU0_9ACTN|nr:DUF1697 domain-containing protein [Dactylosporangium fulvum]UWP87103.1 DUF1697 domain-containing protein [Dactylosporangium fulvum]